MNMQAIMKQAQALQKDMMKAKEEIDNTEFEAKNEFVTVKMNGKKEVLNVELTLPDNFDSEDIEMLQDMILLALNEANKKVDKLTEEKLGKFSNLMPGMF